MPSWIEQRFTDAQAALNANKTYKSVNAKVKDEYWRALRIKEDWESWVKNVLNHPERYEPFDTEKHGLNRHVYFYYNLGQRNRQSIHGRVKGWTGKNIRISSMGKIWSIPKEFVAIDKTQLETVIKESPNSMKKVLSNPMIPDYFSKQWSGIEKMLAQLDAYHERAMISQAKANLIAKNFSLVLDKTLSTLKQAYSLSFIKAEKNNSQITFKGSRTLDGFEADEIVDIFSSAMASAFDQRVNSEPINVHNDTIAAYKIIPSRGHTFTIFISPIKLMAEKKEIKMDINKLRKIIKEAVIAEITSAEKATQAAKLKTQIEKLQKTIAALKHDKKDSTAAQTQVLNLKAQLKKLSAVKTEPAVKKAGIAEAVYKFPGIVQSTAEERIKHLKKIGKSRQEAYKILKPYTNEDYLNKLLDIIYDNKPIYVWTSRGLTKKKINLKESKVADFILWWTDEIDPNEKSKVLNQLKISNYKTFEKLSPSDKDKLIKYYVTAILDEGGPGSGRKWDPNSKTSIERGERNKRHEAEILRQRRNAKRRIDYEPNLTDMGKFADEMMAANKKTKLKETPALVHRISNKMTADKKKKTKTEAAEPWPYYTLKKDGHLYDEDGKKVFIMA